jgi:stearoyl-CoA desaturase (delta-9 desaturase)
LSRRDKYCPVIPLLTDKNDHRSSVRLNSTPTQRQRRRLMTTLDAPVTERAPRKVPGIKPRPGWELPLVYLVVGLPMVGLVVGIVLAVQHGGISLLDAGIAFGFYLFTAFGITVGFHRFFTHQSFKAGRGLKIVLAIGGMMGLEGGVITWVADHRRHHAFADDEGDPHSPWRYGRSPLGLLRGLWWAHTGWLTSQSPKRSVRRTVSGPIR